MNAGGYTCVNCGTWTSMASVHTCQVPLRADYGQTYVTLLGRIAEAAERIAAALEMQVRA